MRHQQVVPGQRWVSDTEPELGLGILLKFEFGRVEMFFPAADEHRQYALESSALRRVAFRAGDTIRLHSGEELVVEGVENRDRLLIYSSGGREIAEAELSDTISFSKPEDRLLGAQVDDLQAFELRVEALHRRHQFRKSAVRGFVGGRVDLIPHQMAIAAEASSRLSPRVLLADEVGLGKTIEACLILHRLHLTGRADRVLILVPEPLVHQWFVELLRRFNLLFSLFDEERCLSIEANEPGVNPFLDSQLVICAMPFLSENQQRGKQVIESGWDLLVVDEAHHLGWKPEEASPGYTLVASLAEKTEGVLLLTATPQQLGPEGHFARLRLLDPDRYTDLPHFLDEMGHYQEVAEVAGRLVAGDAPTGGDTEFFSRQPPRIRGHYETLQAGDESARGLLVSDLLDSFGTGRVMFRNTRKTLSGFPERKASLVPLDGEGERVTKVKWLVGLLEKLGGATKILVICKTRELAEDISGLLQGEVNVKCALFHEELSLVQRDRNAAFFAEEEGARVLICSEIGSEGRNFQFAHHLVLFDLPENPELLEQRIGRLDRIGQSETINIHVPYIKGTDGEVLARWYHEGFGAFEENVRGASEILHGLGGDLAEVTSTPSEGGISRLVGRSRELQIAVAQKMEKGHDRLLELSSSRSDRSAAVLEEIRGVDGDVAFEEFLLRLWDHFGLHVEDIATRDYLLLTADLTTDAFPAIPDEGLSVTFDRVRALGREDISFMSWDHPVVREALDLFLGGEGGNAVFGVMETLGKEAIFLEVYVVVECVAPAELHVERFLPATPVRVMVDHSMQDRTAEKEFENPVLRRGDLPLLLNKGNLRRTLIPGMIDKARHLASTKIPGIVAAATDTMEKQLESEVSRLKSLREINDHVRPEEIAALEEHRDELRRALSAARPRLDAIRLMLRVPEAR